MIIIPKPRSINVSFSLMIVRGGGFRSDIVLGEIHCRGVHVSDTQSASHGFRILMRKKP